MTASRDQTRSAAEVIEALPWRWSVHGRIVLVGALGLVFDGWSVVVAGYVLPLLSHDWRLSTVELGLFGAIGLAGMAAGAFGWGLAADVIGRKRVFILTILVYSIASLLCAVSPTFALLLVFRFIEGAGLGGCLPVDYALISEFTPLKLRGRVVALLGMAFPLGATLCGIVSTALLPVQSWRLLLAVLIVPAFLSVWARKDVPESPLFLIRRGRHEEARRVVDDLVRRTGGAVVEWDERSDRREPPSPGIGRRVAQVWTFDWKLTLTVWLLFIGVFFLYYGALNWMPSILVESGFGRYSAFLNTTLMTGVGIASVVLSAWLVERVGRKLSVLAGGVFSVAGIILFSVLLGNDVMAIVWLSVYGFAVQLLISVIYVYVPEVYPTLLRGTGFGVASAISRVAAAAAPLLLGGVMFPVLGLVGTFSAVSIAVGLALVLLLLFGPETRGRALAVPNTPHRSAGPSTSAVLSSDHNRRRRPGKAQ